MLKTQYAGLELKNPIIAASSGLTDSVEKIIALEKAGVGAVVLKSLFEEQLAAQSEHLLNSSDSDYPEAYDYLQHIVKAHEVEKYLTLIREARKAVSIPVIASINCYDDGSWEAFGRRPRKSRCQCHRTEHTENQPHDRIPPRHHRQAPRRDIAKGQGHRTHTRNGENQPQPLQPGIGCRPVACCRSRRCRTLQPSVATRHRHSYPSPCSRPPIQHTGRTERHPALVGHRLGSGKNAAGRLDRRTQPRRPREGDSGRCIGPPNSAPPSTSTVRPS